MASGWKSKPECRIKHNHSRGAYFYIRRISSLTGRPLCAYHLLGKPVVALSLVIRFSVISEKMTKLLLGCIEVGRER
jgi:hypothetical protein